MDIENNALKLINFLGKSTTELSIKAKTKQKRNKTKPCISDQIFFSNFRFPAITVDPVIVDGCHWRLPFHILRMSIIGYSPLTVLPRTHSTLTLSSSLLPVCFCPHSLPTPSSLWVGSLCHHLVSDHDLFQPWKLQEYLDGPLSCSRIVQIHTLQCHQRDFYI